MTSTIPCRIPRPAVALETTLLVHGVPTRDASALARRLGDAVRTAGAHPAIVGVVSGEPIVGVDERQLDALLSAPDVPKANTSNLGVLMVRGSHAATTVSTTMELAASAGVRVFATGGLGGVHPGYGDAWDVSSDLLAFTRFPVAVVASGVKSILDVVSTREMLESLGVPVVGWRTDDFPAFYRRTSGTRVDARFDEIDELGAFVRTELARTGRGIVVANPVPAEAEISAEDWERWLREASSRASANGAHARDLTPTLLAALHEVSAGATLRTNIELACSNAALAGRLACAIDPEP
ncbi:MAG: pseudouridine-5'-phosphate glycosidase [Planctomycetota bacterium]